jgi:putative ABC transport system ATP-binding protein
VFGFIFLFFALGPVLDAYENVELPRLLSGVGARERKERTLELLDAVGLSDRIHHRPDQLSGGQQQRVAIARALVKRPLMVLADEPTANLDTANGEQAMEIMRRLGAIASTAVRAPGPKLDATDMAELDRLLQRLERKTGRPLKR